MKQKKQLNVEVGARIKSARENAGLTQERFSELIGMGTKSVSALERGTVGVSLSSIQRICQVLSISGDEILFERDIKENDVQALAARLARLSPEQFEITREILNKLFEAFSILN
ncbi:helix-turn-helix domain-containing protein [Oscillibacter sp.]|uniref:helix-turn-helix domain-containing protein n=1 Tax=Oscillibacter sp. TaxID=1945593 RepID=UPI00339B8F23